MAASTFPESRQLVPSPIQREDLYYQRQHGPTMMRLWARPSQFLSNGTLARLSHFEMMNQAETTHAIFKSVVGKGGSDLFGVMRCSNWSCWPDRTAQISGKSDKLVLFDYQTEGLIKMTCVVQSYRAGVDWQAGQQTAQSWRITTAFSSCPPLVCGVCYRFVWDPWWWYPPLVFCSLTSVHHHHNNL